MGLRCTTTRELLDLRSLWRHRPQIWVEFSPSWVVTVLLALFIPVAAIMVILAYLLLGFLLPEDDT